VLRLSSWDGLSFFRSGVKVESMIQSIAEAIQVFEKATNSPRTSQVQIEQVAPHILKISGAKPDSQIKIGILGLVHGNETIGVYILNQLIQDLVLGKLSSRYLIYFALGNVSAAHAGQRFVTNDLNRSFGLLSSETEEMARARELEKHFLDQCDHVLDLHQTISPSRTPFFLFRYSNLEQLTLLNQIHQGLPVILAQQSMHSGQGLTTGEYLRNRGAHGLTVELGEKGFDQERFALGHQICRSFIESLQTKLPPADRITFPVLRQIGLTTISDTSQRLNPGWVNLSPVKKDEIVGNSKQGAIRSPEDGLMLFPKYPAEPKIGGELFNLCRPMTKEEFDEVIRTEPQN
jgi:succinylglutamate desuccinylase